MSALLALSECIQLMQTTVVHEFGQFNDLYST